MKYDFDGYINRRNTNCLKWDTAELIFGAEDVLPMWVADMDFPVAKPIIEALRKRLDHEIFGYTNPGQSVIEAIITRIQRIHGWKVKPEWLVFTPGIIPALHSAVKAFTHPGDDVIIQTPAYYPFFSAIKDNGCQVSSNQLKLVNGHYEIDYKDLEEKFGLKAEMMPSPSRAKMMILCSPHNPVGRVWTKEELVRIGEIIIKNDAVIVSDEVHCEIIFKSSKHIIFGSISDDFEQHSIVCLAPSKAFNLAGLGASVIIIPNMRLRNRFNDAKAGIVPRINVFGLIAMEAAYRDGDEWLEQFSDYLHGNLEFLMEYFKKRIPKIKVINPEGTYLVWLDCRELKMDPMALKNFMRKKCKVGLDDGYLFGSGGEGFQRMNIACSRPILAEAMKRIENAVNLL